MARRVRLDAELVRRGLARSRGEASDIITGGRVTVDGQPAEKPSRQVDPAQAVEVLAPPDLERIFGLQGGSIFQGEQGMNQMAFMRPTPDMAQYATPVAGLYLCGAGTHPGGGVTAASGHNAAQRILKDRRGVKWPWKRRKASA